MFSYSKLCNFTSLTWKTCLLLKDNKVCVCVCVGCLQKSADLYKEKWSLSGFKNFRLYDMKMHKNLMFIQILLDIFRFFNQYLGILFSLYQL